MEDKWLNVEFGARVRERRKKADLSQDDLAAAAKVSRTSVVNIERGRQGVSIGTLYRLANALACNPADLLPLRPAARLPRIAIGDGSREAEQAVLLVMQAGEGARGG